MLPSSTVTLTSPLHGLWRIVPSPMLSEIFAQSGLDFQILDCEHGGYDYATLLPDILACECHGCAPLIRVSGHDKIEVQRCLDLGAHGLVFPQLNTVDDFARAGAMMDCAPLGTRGYNPFVRAGNYGTVGGALCPDSNSDAPSSGPKAPSTITRPARPWFVPIVETLAAAEHIASIAALPRIDLVYIGVYDLSAQLGCPGKLDAPELAQIVEQILAACFAARKPVGMMALSADAAKQLAARGVQALVHGVDSQRIKQGMSEIMQPLRASSFSVSR
jgi:2-keto-3-deoxy-L-rhamnonate aldolase RhmA